MSATNLREIARDLRLKKRLSQNFLVDTTVLDTIVIASQPPGEAITPIIEIGAGAGFLTERFLEAGHAITAIEVDPALIPRLKDLQTRFPALTVLHTDIRRVDLPTLMPNGGTIVGNIPYHLTGPILFQIIGELADAEHPLRQKLTHCLLMVQAEVGRRLLARPGDTDYSQLTLQAGYWFEITPVLNVPRKAYIPSPKVDSMVIRLTPRLVPAVPVKDLSSFSRLIKLGFIHRRKTLFNNLKHANLIPEAPLKAIFDTLPLPTTARAQELSMHQFGALADALHDHA